jgi:D-glycero-alpha-D-manno-heptose-7-phosphate kinase
MDFASKSPRSVTTITPQRLSFAGGGTDLPDFYRQHGGAVVSSTIDKFIYVTEKRHSPLFNELYRLSYSQTEHVQSLEDIKNDIARECLRLVEVEPPLFISTASDLPALSGLGSSSSFAVGLLYALHILRGENVSAGQIAEEACHVEIDVLGRPIGKQDQYAAAFGGLNFISFRKDGRVELDPLWLPGEGAASLFRNSMLFWTGMQRQAGDILGEQRANIDAKQDTLVAMRDLALSCRDALLNFAKDISAFGALLDDGWQAKRTLAQGITSPQIDDFYGRAIKAGALGGKIAGAGGGGFLFLVVPTERQEDVRRSLPDMVEVKIGHEPRGSRLLSVLA